MPTLTVGAQHITIGMQNTCPSGCKTHLIEADANKVRFELNHRDTDSNCRDAVFNHWGDIYNRRDARV